MTSIPRNTNLLERCRIMKGYIKFFIWLGMLVLSCSVFGKRKKHCGLFPIVAIEMTEALLLVCFIILSVIPCNAQQNKRRNNRESSRIVQPLFPVKQNGKWGYIDKTGRVIIKPQFESAHFYHDDL